MSLQPYRCPCFMEGCYGAQLCSKFNDKQTCCRLLPSACEGCIVILCRTQNQRVDIITVNEIEVSDDAAAHLWMYFTGMRAKTGSQRLT